MCLYTENSVLWMLFVLFFLPKIVNCIIFMYILTIRGRQLSQSLEIKGIFDLYNVYVYLYTFEK